MNILFVTSRYVRTGGHIILASLARELLNLGHAVKIVDFKPAGAPAFPNCQEIFSGLPASSIDIPAHANSDAQYRETIETAAAYIREQHSDYDRVILDSWYIMLAGAKAGVAGLTHVYQLAQRDPVFPPENEAAIWKSQLFDLMPIVPMKRVVVGRSLARIFEERYGVTYPVLDLFVDDVYHQADFMVRDRSPLRLVASAANFNLPWKGLEFLLDSLQRLNEQPFELTLIAGRPIEQDLTKYSFPIRVTSAAAPEELVGILTEQDVYICTSTNESFCLALAEAVTLGMPAIALDSVGNRDYAKGDNFIFVADKDDFLTQLQRICQLDVRRKLHEKARASMAEYTRERMLAQFCEALEI